MGLFVSYQMLINPCREMAFSFTKQANFYTSKDFSPLGKQSLLENKLPVLNGEKTIFILDFLQNFLHNFLIFFLVLLGNKPYLQKL